MKHFFLLPLLCLWVSATCSAQGENNIWTFGKKAALDFNSGSPLASGSACYTVEGSASICDRNGVMLFYSDGANVYNRRNKIMPDGSGLMADLSATQGVVIIPFTNDPYQYYLFVLARGQLLYSVVDMRLDGGLGNIVPGLKNVFVTDELSEKMLVTRSAGCGYWLLVHKGASPEFYAYNINASGFNATAVVSVTGWLNDGCLRFYIGEMKVSPDNRKIALANWTPPGDVWTGPKPPGSVELFDFDSTSGKISGFVLLDTIMPRAPYGIQFSPDNTKLYAGFGDDEPRGPYSLLQYDLNLLPDIAAFRAGRTELAKAYNWSGMREQNGKIYVVKNLSTATAICVINDPDKPGTACNFKADVFTFDGFCCGLGNPVPVASPVQAHSYDTFSCHLVSLASREGSSSCLWYDGDTARQRIFTAPAVVWVNSGSGSCTMFSDTFRISKTEELNVQLGNVLCEDAVKELDAGISAAAYLWQDGQQTRTITVPHTGDYWVTVTKGDCIASDTVKVIQCALCIGVPNSFTPNKDGINDGFRPQISCPVLKYSLMIVNRWGQEVFTTQDIDKDWDGTFAGKPLDMGTYFYMAKISFDRPGAGEELYKGAVTLLR